MTAFDYSRSVATADRLIKRFGQSGFLRRFTSTGPPSNPTQTPANHAATFAVLAYTNRQIDGTRILATDQLVYLSAVGLAVTPKLTDKLVDAAGVVYNIILITPFSPAGTVVYYEIQIRR